MPPTPHLRPTAPFAGRALLPGDPGRALALAQELLDEPRMFNHARGLWGYTGNAADGRPLTIQSTGLGGPSAAIVVEELCDLGLEIAVRVGTCRAPDGGAGPTLTPRAYVGARSRASEERPALPSAGRSSSIGGAPGPAPEER